MDSQDYTRPDFSAAALVIIDTQAGFLDGRPYEIPGTTALLPAMRSLAAAFRQASKPIIHIVIIYKSRWGAFYRTPLENHLKGLGISTLVFAGSNFPNCPRTSIYEASERDFRIVVAEDSLSGFYDRGKRELENIGVCCMPAAELSSKLKR